MKVALVHDYLREYGGAERVLEVLHELFPAAPLYTAYFNPQAMGHHGRKFASWDIRTSWMQKMPFANRLISPFRVFAPLMFESFDLSMYDLVISSSSAVYFAKSVLTQPGTLHLSYIHTPPRFLYGYTTSFNYKKNPITHVLAEVANHILRLYDFVLSQRPDILIANSQNVARRIAKFYRRDSIVVYPPVDLAEFKSVRKTVGEYFLVLNRLVRGKGTETAVLACSKLGLALKVAGSGPELPNLKKLASKEVEFLGNVPDVERVSLLAGAKALIVCAEDEDFGITPIEAQAAGTPVIAVAAGGFLETVIEGKTGRFFAKPKEKPSGKEYFSEEAVTNLVRVLEDFDPKDYRVDDCRKNAGRFSKERFKKEILELIKKQGVKLDHARTT